MTEQELAAGQAAGGGSAAAPGGEPAPAGDSSVHYAYLGLALLLYGSVAGWSLYHVRELVKVFEARNLALPALAAPLFSAVTRLGSLVFLPVGALLLAEIVLPRKLTRIYLVLTLAFVLLGLYVGIALYFSALRLGAR